MEFFHSLYLHLVRSSEVCLCCKIVAENRKHLLARDIDRMEDCLLRCIMPTSSQYLVEMCTRGTLMRGESTGGFLLNVHCSEQKLTRLFFQSLTFAELLQCWKFSSKTGPITGKSVYLEF